MENFNVDEFLYLYKTYSLIKLRQVSIEELSINLFNQSNKENDINTMAEIIEEYKNITLFRLCKHFGEYIGEYTYDEEIYVNSIENVSPLVLKNLSIEQKVFVQILFPREDFFLSVHDYIRYIIRNLDIFDISSYIKTSYVKIKLGIYALTHFNDKVFTQQEYSIIITQLLPELDLNYLIPNLIVTNKLNEENINLLRNFFLTRSSPILNRLFCKTLQEFNFSDIHPKIYHELFNHILYTCIKHNFELRNLKFISKLSTTIPQEDFSKLFNTIVNKINSPSELQDTFECMNETYKYISLSDENYEVLWNRFEVIEMNDLYNDLIIYKNLLSLAKEIFPEQYMDKINSKILMIDLTED